MLNREGVQKRIQKRAHTGSPASPGRLLMGALALIALLGTSHPLAVPGIHTPKPSTTACEIRPSTLWLQSLAANGPPQQTVHVQLTVVEAGAEASRTIIPDTSFINASVNGTRARVAQAEWLPEGRMSLLLVVPQSVNGPVRHSVQVRVADSLCSQQVDVPTMPQWQVYVPECADASINMINTGDTERFLNGLLPLAQAGRTSVALPDGWASTWGMASVLAHARVTGVTRRTTSAQTDTPGLFWWEGPDGARVLANMPVNNVTAQPAVQAGDPLVSLITHRAERYATARQTGRYPADAFLLDCGGSDAGALSSALSSDAITAWNQRFAYPHIAGDQDAFFADMAARYGDQLTTVRGGFDTQWNARIAEDVAATQQARADAVARLNMQTLAAIASTHGYSPTTSAPGVMLDQALDVLVNQINTGPASTVVTQSVEPDPYVVVFNTLAWERNAPVTVTIAGDEPLYLTDLGTGNTLYSQCIAPHTLLFIAPNVPSLGYKVFRLERPQPEVDAAQTGGLVTSRSDVNGAPVLSNSRFTMTADLTTGGVSLFDRLLDRQWISGTLDGRAILGNQLLYRVDGAVLNPTQLSASVIATGPVAAQLQITGQFTQGRISSFTQTATLLNGLPYVLFDNAITPAIDSPACEAGSCPVEQLYFAYPINLAQPEMRVDTLGGITNIGTDLLPGVRRDDYAVQSFANASTSEMGATVALPDTVFVEWSGLRTQQGFRTQPASGQLFALAYATARQLQTGTLHWRAGWMPHATGFDAVQSVRFGEEQRTPLLTRRLPINQQGPLPGTSRSYGPLVEGDSGVVMEVVMSVLKPAENGDGLILRLWNPTSLSQTVRLELGALGVQQLQMADGLERPLGDAEPALNTRAITLIANGFLTLRLRREASPADGPSRPPIGVESTSPLPTPTGLSNTLTVTSPTSDSGFATEISATPDTTLLPGTATQTPVYLPTVTEIPPTPEPPATTPVPTPEPITPTPIPSATTAATPLAIPSSTIVSVNAGGTPTTQVTPVPAAPVVPPVVPATAAPLATVGVTPTIASSATTQPATTPLATATPTGTSGAVPLTPTATQTTTAPSARQLSILDSFDGVDGAVGAEWMGNTNRYAIRSKKLISGALASNNLNVMYWRPVFSATQEVAVKFAELTPDEESENWENSAVRLMLKWQGLNTNSLSCYAVRVTYDLSSSTVSVEYCDTESGTSTWPVASGGTFKVAPFITNDIFGAQIDAVGNVRVFKNGTLIGTASVRDWNFVESTTGRVGLWYNDIPKVALDDFAGK